MKFKNYVMTINSTGFYSPANSRTFSKEKWIQPASSRYEKWWQKWAQSQLAISIKTTPMLLLENILNGILTSHVGYYSENENILFHINSENCHFVLVLLSISSCVAYDQNR